MYTCTKIMFFVFKISYYRINQPPTHFVFLNPRLEPYFERPTISFRAENPLFYQHTNVTRSNVYDILFERPFKYSP